jgi:hypothetical protein
MKNELKRAARRLAQIDAELDATKSDLAQAGLVRNQWGQYWRADLVEEWLRLNADFLKLDDADERNAASFSHAMFLLKINRLDEAENILRGISEARPVPALRGKIISKARRGLVEEARAMNAELKTLPHGASWGLPDDELLKEVEIGRQFVESSPK